MEVTTRNLAEGDKESADVKLFRIRLMGHCIFCLRKTSRSKEALRTLPRNCATIEELEEVPNSDLDMLTFSGHLVTTFNRIWPYLQEGKRAGNEEDPLTFLEMPEEKSWKVTKSTRFSRLPKICHFCAENLEAVDRLWRELAGHVKRLRVTVKESKCGGKYKWRGERFEETLRNSDMEVESVRAILEFLEMGDRSSREEGKCDIENVDHGMKECPTPEILITSSNVANEKDNVNCPSTSSNQKSTTIGDTNSRRLSRQDSVEIISRNPTPVEKQQSSDIYTSHENELSIDREEAEEADDERDSEYTMLEQEEDEEEVITISDDDTEEPITTVANMAYKNTGPQMSAFGYATLVTSYTENPTNTNKNVNLNKNKNRIPLLDNAAMERDNLANNNPTATTSSATTSTSVHTQLNQNEEIANQVLANVVHIPTDMVQCSQCHMLFPTWEKLVDHMSKHRNSGLPCDICKDGVKYFIHNLLREHYCTVHGIGEQFPCPLCPAVYFTPQTLKTHIKTRHKNETLQYPQLRN